MGKYAYPLRIQNPAECTWYGHQSHTYRALRRSNLKEMYLVRYADDFKIFCRSYKDAVKAFEATKRWLKDRLGLDISPEKSKVINMEQRYSEFLGFKMKVYRKGKVRGLLTHER